MDGMGLGGWTGLNDMEKGRGVLNLVRLALPILRPLILV